MTPQEIGAVVAVARVDGVIGGLSVTHQDRHVGFQRGSQVAVPLDVALIRAVQFVLHLHHDDGPAAVSEITAGLCDDQREPGANGGQPGLVVGAKANIGTIELQPSRDATFRDKQKRERERMREHK